VLDLKALIVYYTRTGQTKVVAETIRAILQCDVEELADTQKRSGLFGYMRAGRQTMKKELTVLKPLAKDPSQYDVVVVGTPVWVYNLSVPVRTYLEQNKDKIKKLAIFCTHGGKESFGAAFQSAEEITGLLAIAKLNLRTKEVKRAEHVEKTTAFVRKVEEGMAKA